MTYLTILYICLLAVFISAIGGFLSYKVSRKFFNAEALRYILGGIVALLLSYPMTIFLQLGGVWFFHLPIAVLAIVLYVAFYLNSKGNWKLIAWFSCVNCNYCNTRLSNHNLYLLKLTGYARQVLL